jgi:hypothetical protein
MSAEDIILMKLFWRSDSRSEKQWQNALSVVRTMGVRLDWKYLRHWADRLRLAEDLASLLREAES